MKQKQADRPNWGRITERRYHQEYIHGDLFEGYITYLLLDEITEPLFAKYGDEEEICIVNRGYSWMMFFPLHEKYSLTVMINEKYEIVQWYFDIIKSLEFSPLGIPLINDLYLDYILLPNGKLYTKDDKELEDALREGEISSEDYNLAVQKGQELRRSILEKRNELINDTDKYVQRLKSYRENE